MIRLRNVETSRERGLSRTFVLRRFHADVREGELVSIREPSGAGKSTLPYRDLKKSGREAIMCGGLARFQIAGKNGLFPNPLSSSNVLPAHELARPLYSTRAKEIMEVFKRLNDAGKTIVQVTHSETDAAYGHRMIQIADGWIAAA